MGDWKHNYFLQLRILQRIWFLLWTHSTLAGNFLAQPSTISSHSSELRGSVAVKKTLRFCRNGFSPSDILAEEGC